MDLHGLARLGQVNLKELLMSSFSSSFNPELILK
jgi:hypothetical protein